MKGIILAGGKGTRLKPFTNVVNKHVALVFDRPMIYYPIQTLKRFGITDILIVSGREHMGTLFELLGSGKEFGCQFTYRVQDEAGGIAQALGLAEDFVGDNLFAVILGDNIFDNTLNIGNMYLAKDGAKIYTKHVAHANRFGVLEGEQGNTKITEKPKTDEPGNAVTGVYIYTPWVFDIIRTLDISPRGELEITDINNGYLERDMCVVNTVEGFWSDAGTVESLNYASNYVRDHQADFRETTVSVSIPPEGYEL